MCRIRSCWTRWCGGPAHSPTCCRRTSAKRTTCVASSRCLHSFLLASYFLGSPCRSRKNFRDVVRVKYTSTYHVHHALQSHVHRNCGSSSPHAQRLVPWDSLRGQNSYDSLTSQLQRSHRLCSLRRALLPLQSRSATTIATERSAGQMQLAPVSWLLQWTSSPDSLPASQILAGRSVFPALQTWSSLYESRKFQGNNLNGTLYMSYVSCVLKAVLL